ncbi:hypothetical protein W909_11605 [Dickeya zeae EC1]|nr:hypothetical protein W909_11605 [Dickeya zeae EC1]
MRCVCFYILLVIKPFLIEQRHAVIPSATVWLIRYYLVNLSGYPPLWGDT